MSDQDIAEIGMGATISGGILSAFGAIASGFSNKKMYDYQSALARLNQQIDRQNAQFARETGNEQEQQFGLKAGQRMGQIKVAQASSGFDVNSGSNKQVRDSQARLDQMDMNTIRSNATKTAYNYETQAVIAGSQADMYSKAGNQSATAGFINAGSSIIGTASSVSSQWLQGKQAGLFGGGKDDSTPVWSMFGNP